MSRWQWLLMQTVRRLWVRATLIGALGVVAAIAAALTERFIPWRMPGDIDADAVNSILSIIASSMLAVTTFSLSVMTSAYGSATNTVTPRATRLLIEDTVTNNTLSTFVGSFLFSIVGLIVLKTGAYGPRGRFVLFVVTIAVIALVVVALLRWIDHLTRLGRVGETTERVERATQAALQARLEMPFLGGRQLDASRVAPPGGATPVPAGRTGYVQHVDMVALQARADAMSGEIRVLAIPGSFVHPHTSLATIEGGPAPATSEGAGASGFEGGRRDRARPPDDDGAAIRDAFAIGTTRSFDQDPRFGLIVLAEIAMRALSPAVNDSGTAIDIIGRFARLLALWAEGTGQQDTDIAGHTGSHGEARFPCVWVPPLATADMFDDAFRLLARDGAAQVEVQVRLQKTLRALAEMGDADFREAARYQARLAMARAESAMTLEDDRRRVREVFGA